VARLGSYTRAAEELHIAQPTASVQVRKLTETVGMPLLEQVGNRAHLTEAGRELQAVCHEIFRELQRIDDKLSRMCRLEAGRLWLAASTTGRYFVPRMLAAFVRQHPGIHVSLHIHNHEALSKRLADDTDDLYLFAEPPRDAEVVVQQILPNPLVVLARPDHELASQARVPFARLAEEPFLMREAGSGTRASTMAVFARHGLEPRVRMEVSTNEAIREAIRAGLGVSILPRYTFAEPEPEDLVALDVEGFPLEQHWHFVYPVGKQLPAAAHAFMEFTRAHVQRERALERSASAERAAPPTVASPRRWLRP
jgi:DNA-binding transcriptional LysR family regulator